MCSVGLSKISAQYFEFLVAEVPRFLGSIVDIKLGRTVHAERDDTLSLIQMTCAYFQRIPGKEPTIVDTLAPSYVIRRLYATNYLG